MCLSQGRGYTHKKILTYLKMYYRFKQNKLQHLRLLPVRSFRCCNFPACRREAIILHLATRSLDTLPIFMGPGQQLFVDRNRVALNACRATHVATLRRRHSIARHSKAQHGHRYMGNGMFFSLPIFFQPHGLGF